MIKNKEISSAELTKSVFDRIKAVEGKVDAYLTLDEENAMKKAAEIDEKLAKGEELSPLAGIPVGIKDNISTKGLRTTCASKMLGNYVPPFNATVMNKLDDIVVTGKLNMDEFAMGSSTENYILSQQRTHLIQRGYLAVHQADLLPLLQQERLSLPLVLTQADLSDSQLHTAAL